MQTAIRIPWLCCGILFLSVSASFAQECDPPQATVKCDKLVLQAQSEGMTEEQVDAVAALCGGGVRVNLARFHFGRLAPRGRLDHLSALQLNEWAAAELTDSRCVEPATEKLELALERVGGDRLCNAVIQNNLGTAAFWREEYSEALTRYDNALTLVQQMQPGLPLPELASPKFDPKPGLLSCYSNDFHEADLRAQIGATHLRNVPKEAPPAVRRQAIGRAMREYDEIAQLPDNAANRERPLELLDDIASAYFINHDYSDARAAAERLLQSQELSGQSKVSAHRILAVIAQDERDHVQAVDHFQQALASALDARSRWELYRWLAMSQLAAGDVDGAVATYTNAWNAATTEEEKAAALFGRANAYLQRKDAEGWRQGSNDFRSARGSGASPEITASALWHEAYVHFANKAWGDAAARYGELAQFLETHPSLAPEANVASRGDVLYAAAVAQYRAGQKEAAIEMLGRALQAPLAMDRRDVYKRRGFIYSELGRPAESNRDFEAATGSTGGSPYFQRDVQAIMAWNYISLEQYSSAATAADQALAAGYQDTDKDYIPVLRNSAYAHSMQKSYPVAIERYVKIAALTRDDQDIETLGNLYRSQSPPDEDAAFTTYQTLSERAALLRFKNTRTYHIAKARDAFCADDFNTAATWFERLSRVAADAGMAEDRAKALNLVADMHFNQRLMELHRGGAYVPRPRTDADRAPLAAIAGEYERALADPALPVGERSTAALRRAETAYLGYDWDTAERWFRDPAIMGDEQRVAGERLVEIAKLKKAHRIGLMRSPTKYSVRDGSCVN